VISLSSGGYFARLPADSRVKGKKEIAKIIKNFFRIII
jgi:hypothetical protein